MSQNNLRPKSIIERFLDKPLVQTIVFQHAKVAQKSYGTEKRFFCPPPCLYFSGIGWKLKHSENSEKQLSTQTHEIEDEDEGDEDFVHKDQKRGSPSSHICAFMGINSTNKDNVYMPMESNNFCAAKTLYISDSDKSKYFFLTSKLFYSDSSIIGSFQGHNIKVISKPSKKKQSLKNADLCIESGSKIALFNRLRSQTVSTRYLYVEGEDYQASSLHWGAFEINLVSCDAEESNSFTSEPGFIHYGSTVKIVCSVSNIALPLMVVHKVDKQCVVAGAEEPVSQLHKCAFRFKDTPDNQRAYLCLSQEKIVPHFAMEAADGKEMISDGASWTIISTECLKFQFSDAYISNFFPVSPVPIVITVVENGAGVNGFLELTGFNFTPQLRVWFANVQAETILRCDETLICRIPQISQMAYSQKYFKVLDEKHFQVPLTLMRSDGVIYPTDHTYTFSDLQVPPHWFSHFSFNSPSFVQNPLEPQFSLQPSFPYCLRR